MNDNNVVAEFAESLGVSVAESVLHQSVGVSLTALEDLASQLINRANFVSQHKVALTDKELGAYASALILARVGFVQSTFGNKIERVKAIPPKHVRYPAIFYPILQGIGIVKDTDLGIEFRPSVSWGVADIESHYGLVLDAAFFQKVEDNLLLLESIGLQLAKGLPSEPSGSYGYVMVIRAESIVSPSRKAGPVDAVVAAILRSSALEAAVRCPFSYGDISTFSSVNAALAGRAFMAR